MPIFLFLLGNLITGMLNILHCPHATTVCCSLPPPTFFCLYFWFDPLYWFDFCSEKQRVPAPTMHTGDPVCLLFLNPFSVLVWAPWSQLQRWITHTSKIIPFPLWAIRWEVLEGDPWLLPYLGTVLAMVAPLPWYNLHWALVTPFPFFRPLSLGTGSLLC